MYRCSYILCCEYVLGRNVICRPISSCDLSWWSQKHGPFVSDTIRHQNELTEKAWKDAVQGLRQHQTVDSVEASECGSQIAPKKKTPRVRTGELLSLSRKLPFFAQQLSSQAGYATTKIWCEKYLRSRKLF